MISTLRDDQARARDQLRQSLASGKRRPIVQAPTGWGKTLLATAIAEDALAKEERVVFVAPALSLIDQTVDRFYAEGITDIGVIQANHPMTNASRAVQIASAQTLARRFRPIAKWLSEMVIGRPRQRKCISRQIPALLFRHTAC